MRAVITFRIAHIVHVNFVANVYIPTNLGSIVTDLRTCDFPATLTRSGSYAQCCSPSGPCNFYTSCSGNVLIAASTSVSCDTGFCNTGVIVASGGAQSGGASNLGCWATTLGTAPFSLVKTVDSCESISLHLSLYSLGCILYLLKDHTVMLTNVVNDSRHRSTIVFLPAKR